MYSSYTLKPGCEPAVRSDAPASWLYFLSLCTGVQTIQQPGVITEYCETPSARRVFLLVKDKNKIKIPNRCPSVNYGHRTCFAAMSSIHDLNQVYSSHQANGNSMLHTVKRFDYDENECFKYSFFFVIPPSNKMNIFICIFNLIWAKMQIKFIVMRTKTLKMMASLPKPFLATTVLPFLK